MVYQISNTSKQQYEWYFYLKWNQVFKKISNEMTQIIFTKQTLQCQICNGMIIT